MSQNHESHAYDFRKGGQVSAPKPRAKKKPEFKAKSQAQGSNDLTASRRKSLASSTFGLPAKRKYPMPDKGHAADAKGRATQMVKKGKLTPAEKAEIDAKANRILGE